MGILLRPVFAVLANLLALLAAAYFVTGFVLNRAPLELLYVALGFTVLNFLVKPILKLVLGPVIVLTLGLGLVLVNALLLGILDFFSENLTITGIPSLLYAALIVGIVNFIFHLFTKP